MVQLRAKVERALVRMLKELSTRELRETADFALFLKTRSRIDASQAYFWTRKWQAMEQRAQRDKLRGRVLGTGGIRSLLQALKG